MIGKSIRGFVLLAGGILLAAALGRFLIAAGHAQILSLPDPVIAIPLRYAVLIVGILEAIVALICLFGKRIRLQLTWLTWLATYFVAFQAGLLWLGCHPQDTCIGSLTDPLHLSRGSVGSVVAILPIFLLVGTYGASGWLWIARSPKLASSFSKMRCPSCGTNIKFSLQNLGQMIACPHCRATVMLRKSGQNLKTSCYFCKGHIEFPAHAIGTKLACPHCNMDIMLKEPTA